MRAKTNEFWNYVGDGQMPKWSGAGNGCFNGLAPGMSSELAKTMCKAGFCSLCAVAVMNEV